ncbi:MAG TPA: DUF4252 domain-containing protein [Opitutaceae bacterium]|nr:DUF4252 domain-containing protein [Opitutaceae bacterium]
MNRLLHSSLAAVAVGAALSASAFAADPAGYVDFGKFSAAAGREFVEVNLQSGLLKFAAKVAATEEPEAAELLRNISHVRVNVIGMDDSNRVSTVERIEKIRADLEKQGWEKIVTVREGDGKGGDDVAVYMKSKGEDAIEGIVVTVIQDRGEAVLVNVVGDIRAEQLAKLGEHLDVHPLRKLKLKRKQDAEEAT